MGKTKRNAPLVRRNIIHRHARMRSGAGFHNDKRKGNWKMEIQNEMTDMVPPQPVEMSLVEFRNEHDVFNGTQLEDALKEWNEDVLVPTLCREGCETHKDAYCSHGCPSIFVKLGRV